MVTPAGGRLRAGLSGSPRKIILVAGLAVFVISYLLLSECVRATFTQ